MGMLEVVAKVFQADEEAGSALVDMVVYDYLTDLSKEYRPAFDAVVGPWALDRVQEAKRQLARGYVSKAVQGTYPDDEVQQVAGWLVGLEKYLVAAVQPEPVGKAFEWFNYDGTKKQRSVNRDARGRFARAIDQDKGRVSRNPAGMSQDAIHPQVRPYTDSTGKIDPASFPAGQNPDEFAAQAQFAQGQWQEAEQFIGELQRGLPKGTRDEAEAILWVKNEDTNNLRALRIPLKDVKNGRIPNLGSQMPQITERLSHVEIAPSADASRNTVQQIAALNMMGATGSDALVGLAMTDRAKWNQLANAMNVDPKSRDTKLTRFFHQVAAGGGVLSGVPGAEKYGRFAQFVGEMGPEAEKVMGPYVQRAAYRYRGTETSPDKNLVRMFNGAEMKQVDQLAAGGTPSPEALAAASAQATGGRGNGLASRLMTDAVTRMRDGLSRDSLKMQVRADMAGAELVQTLPKDPIIARLSQKAGAILPSQGILINADGKVVSQAVGFADDHYLPFDLKNLGALRGGQYVRTRQAGGLTGEDIYAAVTMGARMVTVASPSGVFTLEMAPDFRGARAMSDKARGMYDRYLKILDAVEGSGEYLEDIPAADKLKIEQDVRALRLDKERTKELIEERTNEARENATRLSPDQIDQIEADLLADKYRGVPKESLRGADARRFADDLAESIETEQAKLANRLRLNGQGYQVALMTLAQQYPYFVKRVDYQTMNDFASQQGVQGVKGRQFASDQGYVRPGGLKANSTQEGYYKPAGPRSWKSGNEETAAASAAPAAPGAAGEKPAAAAATPEAPPAPNTGVTARLAENEKPLMRAAEKSITSLGEAFSELPDSLKVSNTSGGVGGESIKTLTADDQVIDWLVSSSVAPLQAAINDPNDRMKVLAALANRQAVERVFNRRMVDAGQNDHFTSGGSFGGKTSREEAVEWTVNTAARAADSLLLASPFKGSAEVSPGQWQAPTVDQGVSAISDKAQLDDYAASNPTVWNDAVALATASSGTEYNALTNVATTARKRLKAISEMGDLKEQVQRLEGSGTTVHFDRLNMDESDIRLAMGLAPNAPLSVPDVMSFKPEDADRQVKLAWQLAATGRMLEMLDGGDVFPKAWDQRWLVAKSRGRVAILSADHPLSKAVQERVSKGLTPVPNRRVSSRS